MCCCDKDKSPQFQELEAFIKGLPDKRGELITVLHKAQGIFGYLPEEVQAFVAKHLEIPLAKVYGVVTFYSFFTMVPKGKVAVSVCMGTACYVKGADKLSQRLMDELGIQFGETTKDGMFSLESTRCLGTCGLAPVIMVDDQVYGPVSPAEASLILEKYLKKEKAAPKEPAPQA